METKKCFKCNKVKPLSDYYKHPQMGDGHLNKCKECTKNDSNKHRVDNLEYVKAYDKKRNMLPHRVEARKVYISTDNGKESKRKSINKYRTNNKEKTIAVRKVAYNIRKGYLKKEPCIICGSEKSQAHHPDYNFPLNVVWLCAKHHREEHDRLKALLCSNRMNNQ